MTTSLLQSGWLTWKYCSGFWCCGGHLDPSDWMSSSRGNTVVPKEPASAPLPRTATHLSQCDNRTILEQGIRGRSGVQGTAASKLLGDNSKERSKPIPFSPHLMERVEQEMVTRLDHVKQKAETAAQVLANKAQGGAQGCKGEHAGSTEGHSQN
jgi:hypothetical protein